MINIENKKDNNNSLITIIGDGIIDNINEIKTTLLKFSNDNKITINLSNIKSLDITFIQLIILFIKMCEKHEIKIIIQNKKNKLFLNKINELGFTQFKEIINISG